MWRTIPLSKMVLLMVAIGIALSIAEHLVYELRPLYEATPESLLGNVARHAIVEGLYWGCTVGIAMALVTAVLYRRIHKPTLYLFAMVIVATVVTMATQPIPLPYFIKMTAQMPDGGVWLLAYLARSVLMIFASLLAARMYAAQAALRKSTAA